MIAIVDSGPLISLAISNALHLLDEFGRRVRITDVVRAECLRYPDRLGSEIIDRWFAQLDPERYGSWRRLFSRFGTMRSKWKKMEMKRVHQEE